MQALAAVDFYARDDTAFGLNLNGGLRVDGNMTEVVYLPIQLSTSAA